MAVPRTIHQIWIGPHDPPAEMEGWRLPGWEYRLWRDADIEPFDMKNRRLYDAYLRDQRWCGAVNVARVEILAEHGGVYIDADTEMLTPIDGVSWLDAEMFAVASGHKEGRLSNAVMGGVPRASGMLAYRRALRRVWPYRSKSIHPSWQKSGAGVLGKVAKQHAVTVIPAGAFFPENMRGEKVDHDGTVYGRHYFGTTNGLFPSK